MNSRIEKNQLASPARRGNLEKDPSSQHGLSEQGNSRCDISKSKFNSRLTLLGYKISFYRAVWMRGCWRHFVAPMVEVRGTGPRWHSLSLGPAVPEPSAPSASE